jgi:hypothetical protein
MDKTTICAILAAIAAAISLVAIPLFDGAAETKPDLPALGTATAIAFGLFFAKDEKSKR